MYAQLGKIRFDLITSFNGFDEAKSYSYAEHQRIENKPKLQYEHVKLKQWNSQTPKATMADGNYNIARHGSYAARMDWLQEEKGRQVKQQT